MRGKSERSHNIRDEGREKERNLKKKLRMLMEEELILNVRPHKDETALLKSG